MKRIGFNVQEAIVFAWQHLWALNLKRRADGNDLACDTRDGHLNPEPAYSEQDIIDYAVECYEDEKVQQEQDPQYEQDPGEN